MQHARKLSIIDEFNREFKQLQRPADAIARTQKSVDLSKTLNDIDLSDYEKVRRHVSDLLKFFNVGNTQPNTKTTSLKTNINTEHLPVGKRRAKRTRELLSSQSPVPPPRRRRRRREPQRWSPY